ncbi:MAG TPA: GMC family oxidoreductase N-terminal domain-containing protein, partial [Actinomycetota bacterium]
MRDVIVIGAGGGGPVVAKELAQRGLDVLLLEGGARHGNPEQEWSHYENDANNPVTGFLRFGPADRSKPAWLRELPQSCFVFQCSGVGGTTQHYYGNSPRAAPGVFAGYDGADAAAYDRDHLFPFAYRDLIPYYEWVEATLPVQTAAMGTKEQIFLDAAAAMGLPFNTSKNVTRPSFRPQENAILQPGGTAGTTTDAASLVYPKATGCTLCGYCLQGCYEPRHAPRNLYAKRSTDNSYVPMGLSAAGWASGGRNVTLLADAFVTKVHTAQEGGRLVAKGVTWRVGATGEQATEEAKVVVLAGGATESPRLWLNSGLPDPNGWVGRGYTDHFLDWVIGVMPGETGTSKGASSAARVDFPGHGALENVGLGPALEAFTACFSDAGLSGFYDNGRGAPPSGADTRGRLVGTQLRDLIGNLDHILNVLVIPDDDVEKQNGVSLSSAFPADEHGPIAKLEIYPRGRTRRTLDNRAFLVGKAVELLRAGGAKQVHHMDWPPLILHTQSSMRMGADPSDSVIDPNAESWTVKRLFVADTGALSNGVGSSNPTLSGQALATRTAERIFQMYFGGDPWVGREAPVSSVDDAVTRAVLGYPASATGTGPTLVLGTQQGRPDVLPATGGGDHRLLGAATAAAGTIAGLAARRLRNGDRSEQAPE